jgi:hypothetical protein
MRTNILRYSGIIASVILIAFGVGSLYMGIDGRNEVRSTLAAEKIVGTPDSTIRARRSTRAPRPAPSPMSCASTRSRRPAGRPTRRWTASSTPTGKPTSDEAAAAKDPKTGAPVENGARNIWVTETALSTALNTAFFAENVATFAIVMGIALLLVGIGFLVLASSALRPAAAKSPETVAGRGAPRAVTS